MTLTNNGLKRVLGWLRNIQQGQCALRSDVEIARLAADEIDRLRAEVERLKAFIADRIHDATIERMMMEMSDE